MSSGSWEKSESISSTWPAPASSATANPATYARPRPPLAARRQTPTPSPPAAPAMGRRTLVTTSVPEPTNSQIAAALEELGDLYELDGAIVHRVVAYRNAAKAVREAPVSVAGLARAGRATELAGIGDTLQDKIQALVDTGQIPAAEKLRAKFPPRLVAITRLAGLGPKRARMLYDELGIDS